MNCIHYVVQQLYDGRVRVVLVRCRYLGRLDASDVSQPLPRGVAQ